MQHVLVNKPVYGAHFAFISSFRRLFFSTSLFPAENPPVESNFAVEYLVKSCGLPKEKAVKASKYIPQLKSPAKADSVLQFLRQIGLADADITKAVNSQPRILCASLEKTIKPRLLKIQEMGFSPAQVARLIPLTTIMLKFGHGSLQRSIEFWKPFFGSLEGILRALKKAPFLLTTSIEKVVEPNISFLQEHFGLSPIQIGKMITTAPSLFSFNPNTLDAKVKNLKNIGFSSDEINSMVMMQPMLLANSAERVRSAIAFLGSEAGLDMSYIAGHPVLIRLSLERRIIPRNYVLKSLESKGLCEVLSFWSVMSITEERFADKFVRPYKDIIPEVLEAYETARAGRISLKGRKLQEKELNRFEASVGKTQMGKCEEIEREIDLLTRMD